MTNHDYELCAQAIEQFRNGNYASLELACESLSANLNLALEMCQHESVMLPEPASAVDQQNRSLICQSCDENISGYCNQCACPITFIISVVDKQCPIGKW